MTTFNPSDLGNSEMKVERPSQQQKVKRPKRISVGFKIDEDTYNLGLEMFPLRGELTAVIRDIFLEDILGRLKDDPEKLAAIRQKYMENLKVRRGKS
jgi:hypothetical protein